MTTANQEVVNHDSWLREITCRPCSYMVGPWAITRDTAGRVTMAFIRTDGTAVDEHSCSSLRAAEEMARRLCGGKAAYDWNVAE